MRPDRVAALALIGFLRRWVVVTRESEQIAKQPPDLIPQISSLTDVEDLVCLRRHISPWLFRSDINLCSFGRTFPRAVRDVAQVVTNFARPPQLIPRLAVHKMPSSCPHVFKQITSDAFRAGQPTSPEGVVPKNSAIKTRPP